MSGRRSRTKGHGFERKIAQLFRPFFPRARRKLEYQVNDIDGVDIEGTGKLRIQCKKYKNYAPINKIEEIHEKAGTIPALITQGDHKPAIICLRLEDFFDIIKDPAILLEE